MSDTTTTAAPALRPAGRIMDDPTMIADALRRLLDGRPQPADRVMTERLITTLRAAVRAAERSEA